MNFDAAFVNKHGVEFVIFATTMDIISNEEQTDNLIKYCEERIFVGYQVVLMAQDSQGKSHYYGKKDLIGLLEAINSSKIHFRRY